MTLEPEKKERLEPIATPSLYPIQRSRKIETCGLYWVPVYSNPLHWRERQWLMAFFDELHTFLAEQHKLRQEAFLQMKLVAPLGVPKDLFHRHQMELMPRMGLSRKPGAQLPRIPTEEELEPILQGKKKFEFNDYVGDYCMWFLTRKERWRRELFLGFGGYTMLYLLPDLETVPPPIPNYPAIRENPVFSIFDVDALWETTFLLSDRFCKRSKEVFGRGLEDDLSFPGISFIIPRMNSKDFHDTQPAVIEEWFTVFDVFIQESPEDKGILIASKFSIDEALSDILRKLQSNQIDHPFLKKEPA
ncbi:MAG TPA: hypothetical protein VHT24_05825 [Pseudacidobacterium sp.]|jgi:hypothetical protein|nr:hypothetical protein [Pseudacidobacterium sp.]